MTNQNICYEDKRRRISPVVYDANRSQIPFLEILAYNKAGERHANEAAPTNNPVVEETFFHMLKKQDKGNVRELAKLLLRSGMRTYFSGNAVKNCLTGNPKQYEKLWILGVPWSDNPEVITLRQRVVSHLEKVAGQRMLFDLGNKGDKRFHIVDEHKANQNDSNRSFNLIAVSEGVVQNVSHKIWKPSDIFLTLSSRPSFQQLR